MSRIVVDPGHGMGNRRPGVFDPGAVSDSGIREADEALRYGHLLQGQLISLGQAVAMTRNDNDQYCPLSARVKLAGEFIADALISLHLNADAEIGDSEPDESRKGFEVLWRDPDSGPLASLVKSRLLSSGIKAFGQGMKYRPDLYVISYRRSLLVEIGFIDDPEDLSDMLGENYALTFCKILSQAVVDALSQS